MDDQLIPQDEPSQLVHFKQLFLRFLEHSLTPSAPVILIGLAICLFFPIFLHWYLSRTTAYITLPSVLVAGPSGAGKTALTTLFERRDKPAATYTSQVPNVVELATSDDPSTSSYRDDLDATGSTAIKFLLVDTPGHGKLRAAALESLTPTASAAAKLKAVVFMVDAGALADPEGLAVAGSYLYDVLLRLQKRTGATVSSKAPPAIPVLIASNKADLFTALPAPLVKAHLEAELGRLRETRSKGLLDSSVGADDVVDAPEAGDEWLGEYPSAKFAFGQMREFDIEVDVIGGNIVGDGPGVDKWWTWIADKV